MEEKNWKNIFLENFSQNSTARSIVEPPQIEGSTFDDWLYFFIQNAFIFFVWILSMVWVCFVIFYHSRLIGFIITKIVNYLFIKNGYFKIGSFSFASISGKIMFRDLVYINEDYSIRIQDGWIVFCYWIPYIYRDAKTEDLSNSDVRLLIFLDGVKVHIYNQTKRYSALAKIFNLAPEIWEDVLKDYHEDKSEQERREKILKSMNQTRTINELKQSIWRDLIAMIKIEISSGCFIFGNNLIPWNLSISFEDSQFHYTSQPAASIYDLLTHILKGKAENLQVMLVPSNKYSGKINDEPPRIMGEGFNVFRTNKIEIYYYQDVPGFVTEESILETDNTLPAWGMVVKCGKGTDFSYGPWADRQRSSIYNFFFPPDYQLIPVDQKPKIGERRRFESFDIRLSTLHEAKIDILFSRNKETHALHINAFPGSYLEVTIPWVCNENGYHTHILGQILHLDATTSLQYRPLISSETLEFDVKIFFPRIWNAHQEWLCKITACKATVNLIFAHKIFIQDLIDDWSDKECPDILKFIPYTWKISIVIKDFELLVLANQYNWIDCATDLKDENCKIAVCGEHFDVAFDLPFIEFLPPKLMVKIWIQGECLEGAFYIPESSMNRDIVELIQQFSTLIDRNGTCDNYLNYFGQKRKWKNVVSRENFWYDCMSAPIMALSITYDFWLMPILQNQSNGIKNELDQSEFDVTTLQPDIMTVELEIGPMNLAVFGVLFRYLWNIKENYLGEYQAFNEMGPNFFNDKFTTKKRTETVSSEKKDKTNFEIELEPKKVFDPRLYRPFEVLVSVTLHEIHGHLVQCLSNTQNYLPVVYIEKLCFELQKGYLETKLQLLISPAVLQIKDQNQKVDFPESFQEGFLTLSSLQFRGNAMFSGLGRPLQSETLEYAWLVDVEVGEIGGRVTLDQLIQILTPLEIFYFQVLQSDLDLQMPNPFYKCLHDQLQNECSDSDMFSNKLCPYPEDVKYKLVRFQLNKIDIFLVESNITVHVNIPVTKIATCNRHISNEFDGFTLLISDVYLRQFVSLTSIKNLSKSNEWAEISFVSTGPIFIDSVIASSILDNYSISQMEFLQKHDSRTKRLWFLWNNNEKCGCIGNCSFFGCNLSGQDFFNDYFTGTKTTKIKNHKLCDCYGKTIHDHSNVINLDYGESLLKPENFLLHIHSPLIDETKAILSKSSKQKSFQQSDSLNSECKVNSDLLTKPEGTISKSAVSSDRFFSAEDLYLYGLNSNPLSSNTERSISNNEKSLPTSSPYLSPQGITSTSQYMTAKDQLSSDLSYDTLPKLSSISSDSPTLVSPKNPDTDSVHSEPISQTIDDQMSTNSFLSAVSDQHTYDFVDLRNQLEKPIIDSPLLMSAYSNYLSKYLSENIDVPPPFQFNDIQYSKVCNYFRIKTPQALQFEKLIFEYRNNWKPKFILTNPGFSETRLYHYMDNDKQEKNEFIPGIVAKKLKISNIKDCSFLSNNEVIFSQPKPFLNVPETARSRAATTVAKDDEKEKDKSRSEILSYTSINTNVACDVENVIDHVYIHVKFSQIQIKISTLTVDVMSSVMTSLTEAFSKLHPVTMLNQFSFSAIERLEAKNILKKKKPLYIAQLHSNAWKILKHRQNIKHLNRSISFADRNSKLTTEFGLPPNILVARKLQLDRKLFLKFNTEIDRINISSFQASIVEEIIPFSSLDNVKDLTCVLVFNVSFNQLRFDMTQQFREKRALFVFMDHSSVNNLSLAEKALMIKVFFTKKQKKVFSEIEINAFETTDAFINETEYSLSLFNVQSQLSRLINSPEIVKEATLAVIPCFKTKVDFIYMSPIESLNFLSHNKFNKSLSRSSSSSSKKILKHQSSVEVDQMEFLKTRNETQKCEHFNAFVMFECGIQDLSFSMQKSSYFNAIKSENKPSSSNEAEIIVDSTEIHSKPQTESNIKGKISNVWFHFASSPKKCTTYKNDFDRYDWHLLSSLIPLTIAWISVFDRVMYKYDQFKNAKHFRLCSSMACLMTGTLCEYLNKKNNEKLIKPLQNNSKQMIRIFSAFTKTIQDDPSFNLVNVLRLYFKNSFKNNDEFEAYFINSSSIPNLRDLEKCLLLLLYHWKHVLNLPVSNFVQLFLRNQQPAASHTKMTFQSTKNQLLSLLEEKINLMMNNPTHETELKSMASNVINETVRGKSFINSMADNDSYNINMNEFDAETTKLIYNQKQLNERIDTVRNEEIDFQADVSSNFTHNTFPDLDSKRRCNTLSKRQNRVHFAAISRARTLYDRFLATPIIRNVTALCNNRICSICSFKKLKCTENRSDSDIQLERLDSPVVNYSVINVEPQINSKTMIKQESGNKNQLDSDFFNQIDRYSSQSNYDKKDLYWWMVKQQNYMKNNASNTFKAEAPYMNLTQDSNLDSIMPCIDPEISKTSKIENEQQKETEFDANKKLPHEIKRKPLGYWEAAQYFENISYSLNLSNSLKFDKLTEESETIFGTDITISFNIKKFCFEVEEAEQDIEKNLFDDRTLQLLQSYKINNILNMNTPSFVCNNFTISSVISNKNLLQAKELSIGNLNEFQNKNDIIFNSAPNLTSHIKFLLKTLQKKSNDDLDLDFESINLIVFNVKIERITQTINLPLLRFVHQFTNIYENISQTRFEMRTNLKIFTENNIPDHDSISFNSSLSTNTSSKSSIEIKDQTIINVETVNELSKKCTLEQAERIENCWKTVFLFLEEYQQNKLKQFSKQPSIKPESNLMEFNELSDFYSLYSCFFNKPLIIVGNFAVKKMNLIAMLSSLKLEGELDCFNLQLSHQECRKKLKPRKKFFDEISIKNIMNSSIDFNLDRTILSLYESLFNINEKQSNLSPGLNQLVVKLIVEKSNVNLVRKKESDFETDFDIVKLDDILKLLCKESSFKPNTDSNLARIIIENIEVDIPQHPVALHGMMTRSGKQLSTTLQELRYSRQSSRTSRQPTMTNQNNTSDNTDFRVPPSPLVLNSSMSSSSQMNYDINSKRVSERPEVKRLVSLNLKSAPKPNTDTLHFFNVQRNNRKPQTIIPFIIDFNFILENVSIKASLLPSLQAKYRLGQVTSSGNTGSKAKFIVDINNHSLCFNAKMETFGDNSLPTGASIKLPRIHVDAEYKTESENSNSNSEVISQGIVFRKGSYLNMVSEISSFEHCLTTDLLNHLLFVQKVFMKEINEVLQKVSRNEDQDFSFTQKSDDSNMWLNRENKTILFSLYLKMAGIQITATTPTNSAVRFETGTIDLRVSNRLMNTSERNLNFKIFVRVELDFNLALGQLIRNTIFEEAEPDFQQLAYFKTKFCMRNASQNQMLNTQLEIEDDDKEVILIILKRPLVYIQPLALDKAILVWINYKNAYEYWNEQRASLTSEVIQATQQVFDKMHPFTQSFSSSQSLGTLLVQLAVDDFGICLPMSSGANISKMSNPNRIIYDSDIKDALVLTLESTRISALSRGALASQGEFKNLCIRFADDFGTMFDDWKPNPADASIQNLCIVSEGTYQICSRTITHKKNADLQPLAEQNFSAEAKWILNVSWKMDGFDIHMDTSIGKHISALFKTMTAIAGDEDFDDEDDDDEDEDEEVTELKDTEFPAKLVNTNSDQKEMKFIRSESLKCSSIVDGPITDKSRNLTAKESIKKRNIEKEFNEQAKIINDLKQLGASNQTIQQEIERFQKLEAAVFNNFRRDVIKKLKRPANKANGTTDMNKNRAYSTSIYSYDELDKYANDPIPRKNTFYKINEEFSNTSTRSPTIRSSTISIPHLSYDGDDGCTPNTPLTTSNTSSCNIAEECSDANETIADKINFNPKKFSFDVIDQDADKNTQNTQSVPLNIEPRIDFELDIKIFFNSGKCVLHTKEPNKSEIDNTNRNDSSYDINSQTTNNTRSQKSLNKSRSTNRLSKGLNHSHRKDYSPSVGMNPDFTVFLIPGLDIKLNYSSKNINCQTEDSSGQTNRNSKLFHAQSCSQQESNLINRSKSTKKAFLFAWITLSSIPEEIFISPHLLDFFEEALKPIPLSVSGQNSANATLSSIQSQQFTNQMQGMDKSTSHYVYNSSFPVDVIVFFNFQPMIIRLGCLPISRVECLLHLPSIDLVISSNSSEIDAAANIDATSNKTFKGLTSGLDVQLNSNNLPNSGGGLCITGCLADFSLYIFHPYGGQNKTATINNLKNSSYSTNERKDSLSLQVEFVKINISRSRKMIVNDSLTQSISFSAICDIGTATFKYDVRRLNEILAFPKAWYRKSIWKKVFIGENTLNAIFSDDEEDENKFDIQSDHISQTDYLYSSSSSTSLSNEFSLESCPQLKNKSSKKKRKAKSHIITVVNNPWETLVLLTMNFSKLNVLMNMGNIMGNVNWQTKELMCDGSISIDSNGHQKFRFEVFLNNSTLDAKGGIIGGIVQLYNIRSLIMIKEDKNQEPQHKLCFAFRTLENRVDYMGTSILMIRISDVNASFYDEWNSIANNLSIQECSDSTKKQASIYVHGSLKWDQMQILMSKSTSPDFIKIISKLEEFFTQQVHSGKRVFDSLHPTPKSNSISEKIKPKRLYSIDSVNSINESNTNENISVETDKIISQPTPKFHRYWNKAFQLLTNSIFSKKPAFILGGEIEILAENISLACFYGVNFRSKSWAVFSLKKPSITFMTEAQLVDLENDNEKQFDTHMIQNLSLVLGRQDSTTQDTMNNNNSHRTMAIVSKISRTVVFPPQFRHLHEWFHYAFGPIEIDDVDRFPLPDNTDFDILSETLPHSSSDVKNNPFDRRIKSISEFHYKEEMIFAFPSMQFELKTEHTQRSQSPSYSIPIPKVLFSFISDFDDHIYVAVDAEAYFFLHDLISSYINESTVNSSYPIEKELNSNDLKKSEKETTNEKKVQPINIGDCREFICKVWHLEPTVRLHSWASKNIEPYGVDYILQRLGFSQARTTIPKWIQRSTMDAADKIISIVIYQMLKKNRENAK